MLDIGDTFKVKGVDKFVEVIDFDDDIIEFRLKNSLKIFSLSNVKLKSMELSGEIKLISKG
jgi:hypothetical protein